MRLAVAAPVLLAVAFAVPAARGETKYARVALKNESNVTVVFEMKWSNKDKVKEVVLDPGQKFTAETAFPPSPTKPVLTVAFQPAPRREKEVMQLESGHIDPTTNNPGRVYEFFRKRTNEGVIVVLKQQ